MNDSIRSHRGGVDLLHGNILRSLILFSLPLLASHAFQQLYNSMDTFLVGNVLGDVSLAAIGACTPIYDWLVGFALGVGNGMGIVVARCFGAQDEALLKRAVCGSVIIGVGVTTVLAVLSRLGMHPLLVLLGTPADILEESYSYIITVTTCVGVMFAYNLLAGLLRAIGNSVMPLVFLVFSSLLNIGLDLLLMVQFQMGIRGAAVATVLAQGVSALLCLGYILLRCRLLIPSREHFAVDGVLYRELFTQGVSMGLMTGIVSTGTVILQSAINGFGYLIIAGHTAARRLFSLSLLPLTSLQLAASTFVSQNRGADQRERIRKGVRCACLLSAGWALIAVLLMFFFSRPILQLLSGSEEEELLQYGVSYLRFSSPFYVILGVLLNLRNALQGLGYKLIPLVSSVIEFLGKIVFVWLLIPRLGVTGVILCEPLIWCVMTAQLVWSYLHNPYMAGTETTAV